MHTVNSSIENNESEISITETDPGIGEILTEEEIDKKDKKPLTEEQIHNWLALDPQIKKSMEEKGIKLNPEIKQNSIIKENESQEKDDYKNPTDEEINISMLKDPIVIKLMEKRDKTHTRKFNGSSYKRRTYIN